MERFGMCSSFEQAYHHCCIDRMRMHGLVSVKQSLIGMPMHEGLAYLNSRLGNIALLTGAWKCLAAHRLFLFKICSCSAANW